MQTDHIIERLQQQVQAGTCRISTACSRLENTIQTLCKDEMTRPFLTVLPRILSVLFGDERDAGWLESAPDEDSIHALWQLLKPSGTLFGAALAHSGLDCVSPFEFPAAQLPVPLQKHLQRSGTLGLPIPLDSCIVNVAKESSPLYIMRLDASEFFIYRLLLVLLSFRKHHGVGLGGGKSRSGSIAGLSRSVSFESMTIRLGNEKAFRFQNSHAARTYQRLIDAYQCYFIPSPAFDLPSHGETAFSVKFMKSSAGVWTGWRLASLFFTGISELWLHQYEYRIDASAHIDSDPSFSLPSVDHFEALRVTTRHLVTAVCYPKRPDIPQQMLRFYDQLVDSSYITFRVYLYRLLRLSLAKCPSDNTVTVVGGLWLDFIAPWKYLSIGSDRESSQLEWSQYVVNNYFFYHTLLGALLDYVEVIVEGFGEALSNTGAHIDLDTTRSALAPLLLLLARILSAVSPYSDLLREIEENELVTPRIDSNGTFIRRAPVPLRNVKEQLRAIEAERFIFLPLFDDTSKQRALRIYFWMERIYAALPESDLHGRPANLRHLEDETHESQLDLRSIITQCEDELGAIFSIGNEYSAFESKYEEMRKLQAVIPSTGAMHRRRIIPALIPDERMTLKMRVKATDTQSVKSYESEMLVNVTFWLSAQLNHHFDKFVEWVERRQSVGRVPQWVRSYRFNTRFLAAYPNLLFIGMAYLVFRLLLAVIF